MEPVSYLLIIGVCLLLSAFFAGAEVALLRLRPDEVDADIKEAKSPAAVAARDLQKSTSHLLVTILLGNNIVNILAAATASGLATHYLGDKWGIIASTVIMTPLLVIFAEVVPKAFAAEAPKRVAYLVALPLYLIHYAFTFFHIIFDRIIDPFINRFAGKGTGPIDVTDQIIRLARQVRQTTEVSPASIIASAAGAEKRMVSEIMIPRAEISAFSIDTDPEALLDKMLEERYTRVPLYRKSLDDFAGVVHLKDLVKLLRQRKTNIHEIIKPVLRVPERKPILQLLREMQRTLTHMAIVKDEFGVTQGLITQEDILEELVGELRDEFDKDELESMQKISDDSYLAVGRLLVLDFNRATGWDIQAERGDTLSGFVYNLLGRAPHKGDVVRHHHYEFSVTAVQGTTISQLRIQNLSSQDSEASA